MNPKAIFFILLVFLIAGCSSSRITTSWTPKDVYPKKYNKILVLGVIRETDRSIREKMENHLVGDLQALGYDAVSALKEYGPKAFENIDEESVAKKLVADNIDAVMTIVLLDKKKEQHYVPARVINSPYYKYHDRLWWYYNTMFDRIYSKGYYTESTKYFWESNFYDVSAKELLYSVQTESFDPVSSETLAHEYGKMIVDNMVKNRVISKQVSVAKAY